MQLILLLLKFSITIPGLLRGKVLPQTPHLSPQKVLNKKFLKVLWDDAMRICTEFDQLSDQTLSD